MCPAREKVKTKKGNQKHRKTTVMGVGEWKETGNQQTEKGGHLTGVSP